MTQKLKFYARGSDLVPVPGMPITYSGGQVPQYVGRKTKIEPGNGNSYPATETPFEVDPSDPIARRLVKLCRRDSCLWPADKETAAACGVPFVPVTYDAGEWVRAQAEPKPPGGSAGRKKETA